MTNKSEHIADTANALKKSILDILETVTDPEIPVLSIIDLGIIRDLIITPSLSNAIPKLEIVVTPTYSGCPAMDTIKMNIRFSLLAAGYNQINIRQILSPAWTTDWMSEQGKEKLKAYGIAPPLHQHTVCNPDSFQKEIAIACPLCNSFHTRLVSQFGSTACKALYQCLDCKEPFDYFKCH